MSLSGDVVKSALVPVPLGNLVNCHTDLLRYMHLLGIGPDRLLLEILLQDHHLVLVLPLPVVLPPLHHVLSVLLFPHHGQRLSI